MTPDEYDRFIASPFVDESIGVDDGVHLLLVAGDRDGGGAIRAPGSLPVVVAWVGESLGGDGPVAADLVVGADDVDHVVALVDRCPLAATSFVTLLRAIETVPVDEALAIESAVYSTLQSGAEFAAWRAGVTPRMVVADGPVVLATRREAELVVELDRPARHNAITAQLRDELHAALAIAVADPAIDHVTLRGRGPSFSSGGDLAEFGSRADPASAHRVRLARSPARSLHRIADRLTVRVHGATLGGGLEMAAFAGRLVAHPSTRFGLPEVGLGLVPGAGGTVSVPRRIGRRRTAALALATDRIDADTALAWGLVDEIDDAWAG